MKKYLKQHFFDFILCVLLSAGLSVNVFAGFDMNERNLILYGITIGAVIILVFCTARTRAGILILFLAGNYMTAFFSFLKYPVSMAGYLIFLVSAFVLFLYRVHCISMRQFDISLKEGKSQMIQPILFSLIAVLLAGGVFCGIIKPLSPATDEAKLSEMLMSMQIMEKLGVATTRIVYSEQPVAQAAQSKAVQNVPEQKNMNQDNKEQKKQKEEGQIGSSNIMIRVMAITYKKVVNMLWIIVPILILVFIAAVGFKWFLRKKWYSDLHGKTKEDCAVELYLLFIKKMQKAGFKRPSNLTLLEYAADSKEKLERFTAYDANFFRLTEIYLAILYGYQHISDKECELFHDFYKDFYQNLRKEMGTFHYYLQFFTI